MPIYRVEKRHEHFITKQTIITEGNLDHPASIEVVRQEIAKGNITVDHAVWDTHVIGPHIKWSFNVIVPG